jgi:vancomycin permeability regulator SanA
MSGEALEGDGDASRSVGSHVRLDGGWIVILGAAVWRDGAPSPALRRRVAAGARAAHAHPTVRLLPTGAIGRHPPSEASVMRQLLLEAGIDAARIALEEQGNDTLSSLRHCARIIGTHPGDRIAVCSDAYHVPRCRAIFWALGVRSDALPARGALRALGARRFAIAVLREIAATPWDVGLALVARWRNR